MKYPPDRQPSTTAPHFDGSQACLDADLDLFFPGPGNQGREAVAAAKKLCASCRFIAPCLSYALAHDAVGVWGHTTTHERRAIRARRRQRDLVGLAS